MPLQSIAGIDIYEKKDGKRKWLGCYTPKTSFQNKIYCKLEFEEKKEREICIYLPNFSQIQLIEIGMVEDATLYSGKSRIGNPIAIYGSSVTQGCASSRPALSYANLLAWKTGKEVLNFGFSGSARGEIEIAKYIGTIPLDGIILEYDHNVSVDELKETHYKFYKELRRQQKKTPIILFSRTSGGLSVSSDEERERYCVIKRTFTIARNSGDMNIYLVRGNEFFEEKEIYFVDDRHPNDFGMFKISQNLANVWREIY